MPSPQPWLLCIVASDLHKIRHVRDNRWRPQPAIIMGMPIPPGLLLLLLPVVRDCSHEVKGTTMIRGTGKNLNNNPEKLLARGSRVYGSPSYST
jgi:hypothetical protein